MPLPVAFDPPVEGFVFQIATTFCLLPTLIIAGPEASRKLQTPTRSRKS